jgi:protein SCO1
MKNPIVLAGAIGLVIGVVAAVIFLAAPKMGPGTETTSTGKALIGGPFSLLNSEGQRVTEKNFAGHPMLVYFGFTHCPDVCPSGLQVIAAALDKLGPDGENITPLFITLDPERDTPAVLGAYVKSFHKRIVGLSGSLEETTAAAKAYRVYFKKVSDQATPGEYSVDHSTFMYLIDSQGNYRKHFNHAVGVDELAEGLAKLK